MEIEQIQLSSGPLSFSALSIGKGPLVICLHGFPDNAQSYRHQLPVLAEAGYRAVSITLRGYEPSSQPSDSDYSLETIAADVPAFIEQLGEQRAHLVGHDWGAAIAYNAGFQSPECFKSLTTMAVPHSGRFLTEAIKYPKQLGLSWYMGFFKLPLISGYVVERDDYAFIRKLWRDWSPGWKAPEADLQNVIETFRQSGVKEAALAYYRQTIALKAFTPSAFAAAKYKVPVSTMALTGTRDKCIDSNVFQSMMHEEDFPMGLEVHQVADAGHFPHQEQPDTVNGLLLDWLSRWEP